MLPLVQIFDCMPQKCCFEKGLHFEFKGALQRRATVSRKIKNALQNNTIWLKGKIVHSSGHATGYLDWSMIVITVITLNILQNNQRHLFVPVSVTTDCRVTGTSKPAFVEYNQSAPLPSKV